MQDGPVKKENSSLFFIFFLSKCSPLPSCHIVCPWSGKIAAYFTLSKILAFISIIFVACTDDPLDHDHLGFPDLSAPFYLPGAVGTPDFFPSLAPDGSWLRAPSSHPKKKSIPDLCASFDCGCGPV